MQRGTPWGPLDGVDDCVIHQRVKRFSGLFPPGVRPFEACDVLVDRHIHSAYRPHDGFSWVIIEGVDPACGVTDADVDWSALKVPPPSAPDSEARIATA